MPFVDLGQSPYLKTKKKSPNKPTPPKTKEQLPPPPNQTKNTREETTPSPLEKVWAVDVKDIYPLSELLRTNDNSQDHYRTRGKEEDSCTITHNDPEKANILPQLYLIKVLWTGFSACITATKKPTNKKLTEHIYILDCQLQTHNYNLNIKYNGLASCIIMFS